MNKKYVGVTIPVPKAIADELERKRAELTATLGFEPSRTEVIAWLIKQHDDSKYENQNLVSEKP